MDHSIEEIAAALGARAFGAVSLRVRGAAEPSAAGPDELALAMTPAYGAALAEGRARAAVIWPGADWRALGLEAAIEAPRARLAMARLTQALDLRETGPGGVHPSAVVAASAVLGEGVAVGPLAIVGEAARIGPGTVIGAHASVAESAVLGRDCRIGEGVRIGRKVRLGARVIVQPGAVIGGDGFSFVTEQPSNAERARELLGAERLEPPEDGTWHRIHSLGGVEIGDDVEIGANTCVDSGTIRPTRVGRGTKIDNLVQIGHNVVLGEDCLVCGMAGIAGSSVIGDRAVLGGASGVNDNITVGADAVLAMGTMAVSRVPPGAVVMGYPAMPMPAHLASYRALRRLPRVLRDFASLTKTVPKDGDSD
ncbi:UDP-3-O-(3-hydroxymyristoyl)glucosamine N-acyltransferase [Histidinibacterium lentulum]|uniref:UDP-3-O-(3-hydroxymyristoyl)glucosamine N-acyltransferase n=1 Tax=Histidinibacterium lentulum TaxID=2480588 RepID=A0A3N2R9D7_9RHOB|nr:UDP-3-O-(3-hydroxymyristoyl)glucosamine N-acyltransferase [Histidinibacterium lentulum]ROU04089.1 UDP-3-O-(3-hydroxymyristoyl)glucosamine N-acyltransferase [Histidinibacterium lentulum]